MFYATQVAEHLEAIGKSWTEISEDSFRKADEIVRLSQEAAAPAFGSRDAARARLTLLNQWIAEVAAFRLDGYTDNVVHTPVMMPVPSRRSGRWGCASRSGRARSDRASAQPRCADLRPWRPARPVGATLRGGRRARSSRRRRSAEQLGQRVPRRVHTRLPRRVVGTENGGLGALMLFASIALWRAARRRKDQLDPWQPESCHPPLVSTPQPPWPAPTVPDRRDEPRSV